MTRYRSIALILVPAALLSVSAYASDRTPAVEECWKGTFAEQHTGAVRELGSTGRGSGYMSSYDGDFKWKAEPAKQKVDSTYVFCFTDRLDDGGTLIANGKRIALDRIGSIRRPATAQDGVIRSTLSILDVREFPRLYGVFSAPGKPDTSLEIQLEPLRERVTVVSGTRDQAGRRIVSWLQAVATRTTP